MGADCILDVKCFLLREISEQSSLPLDVSSSINSSGRGGGIIIDDSVEMNNESIYDKLGSLNVTSFIPTTTSTLNNDENADIEIADLILVVLFCLLIVLTISGNTLVILSIITTKRLR
jgi:hypothetical protein